MSCNRGDEEAVSSAPKTGSPFDNDQFVRATEPFRRELRAHCYRMLGSVEEAEDVLQDTYLRAWRSYARFEGRSSLRVWLYRIATNACLTALQHGNRRVLPSGVAAPSEDPDADPGAAGSEARWLDPIPDELITAESEDPAVIAATRAGVRLALIASLQHLPSRQRAVLILRDVLDLPATEVAAVLDTSSAAVKSALQRARARIEHVAPQADELAEPSEPRALELLQQYMAAFEQADLALLERALRTDATLEMTSSSTWFAGNRNCLRFIRRFLGSPGMYRMLPTRANGQPAAAAYRRDQSGVHQAFALVVLTATTTGITRITLFNDPRLFATFGFPSVQPVDLLEPRDRGPDARLRTVVVVTARPFI
jgi:RNA polymerase sigma-70 factor (ECF subfamily)